MSTRTYQISGLDFSQDEIKQAQQQNKLLSFDLEFSRACNLNCLYCYAGGKKIQNEMSYDEIVSVIEQSVALGAKQVVNIGGGEPLAYKDYWKILRKERALGLKSITFTNGTLITRSVAKKLFDCREGIALKLNTFHHATQDFLAGQKNTGQKIQDALGYLLDVGYATKNGPELAIETIVCQQNYHEIETIYRFCRENNIIPYIEIMTLQGNARVNLSALNTSISENHELFKKLLAYDQEFHSKSWPLTPPIAGHTCQRCLYSIYVRSDGNVQVCPGLDLVHPDMNIRNHSIQWILNHAPIFQTARNIYDHLHGNCGQCEHRNCYGCRGTAFSLTGDYCADDPSCWLSALP